MENPFEIVRRFCLFSATVAACALNIDTLWHCTHSHASFSLIYPSACSSLTFLFLTTCLMKCQAVTGLTKNKQILWIITQMRISQRYIIGILLERRTLISQKQLETKICLIIWEITMTWLTYLTLIGFQYLWSGVICLGRICCISLTCQAFYYLSLGFHHALCFPSSKFARASPVSSLIYPTPDSLRWRQNCSRRQQTCSARPRTFHHSPVAAAPDPIS